MRIVAIVVLSAGAHDRMRLLVMLPLRCWRSFRARCTTTIALVSSFTIARIRCVED